MATETTPLTESEVALIQLRGAAELVTPDEGDIPEMVMDIYRLATDWRRLTEENWRLRRLVEASNASASETLKRIPILSDPIIHEILESVEEAFAPPDVEVSDV